MMPEPQISLKNILREEQKGKLSPIDNDFYAKAHQTIQELVVEKNKTEPDSMKCILLEDELGAARVNFESVVEVRMSKIVRGALTRKSQKNKEKQEPDSMTPEEKELYDALYTLLAGWRSRRLNPDSAEAKGSKMAENVQKVHSDTSVPEKPAAPDLKKDYILVRVLKDIPAFVGLDNRSYVLAKEDVATVPTVNAVALISKKAAVKIGVTSSLY